MDAPKTVFTEQDVGIETADGVADAALAQPAQAGPWPAIIMYPDGFGLRPTKVEMAKRLASEGYVVLVVNPFYRIGRAPVLPADFNRSDPADRARLMKMIEDLDHETVTRDARAFETFLSAQPQVSKSAKMGAVGFCMGGSMTVRAAAALPHRLGAAVSLHGGRLVTEGPDSPHRLVAHTNAAFHIGVAADDDEKEPNVKVIMKAALEAAELPHTLAVYAGTRHGWTVPDSPAYDKAQAAAAWTVMSSTFRSALI